ncbi:hypothetical protein MYAM1_003653 [Malassezia yamatoensis]|uniref:nicotinamidase n=1 Tax=Malassezia yamatoensis TaxID=253288 RepID=A0AAJ5YYD5_9BASI|nr:hypothetical protein MYAM1_003653 [Malassezia yamatoensis]
MEGGIALLVVDMQHDFLDGSLAVPGGREILPNVVRMIREGDWDLVVVTQDYHPPNHISFATRHGVEPFKPHDVPHPYWQDAATVSQMMWPVHCVQGTDGAEVDDEITAALDERKAWGTPVFYVRKGQDSEIDSYSAFATNEYVSFTELAKILFSAQPHPVQTVVVVGLATDYCVLSTAVDSAKFHLRTLVAEDCMRGVDPTSTNVAMQKMQAYDVQVYRTTDELFEAIHRPSPFLG